MSLQVTGGGGRASRTSNLAADTVCFWLKLDAAETDNWSSFWSYQNASSQWRSIYAHEPGDGDNELIYSSDAYTGVVTIEPLQSAGWVFVALVRDGATNNWDFYYRLDAAGSLTFEGTRAGGMSNGIDQVNLFELASFGEEIDDGKITSYKEFSGQLTQTQLMTESQNRAPQESGVNCYLAGDAGTISGSNLIDDSANSNDFTITGTISHNADEPSSMAEPAAGGNLTGTASTAGSLSATTSAVGSFSSTASTSTTLAATVTAVGALSAAVATVSALVATLGSIGSLSATKATTSILSATTSATGNLSATASTSSTLAADVQGNGALSGTTATSSTLSSVLRGDEWDGLLTQLETVAPGLTWFYAPPSDGVDSSLISNIDNAADPGQGNDITASGTERPTLDTTTYARPVISLDGVANRLAGQVDYVAQFDSHTRILAGWDMQSNNTIGCLGSTDGGLSNHYFAFQGSSLVRRYVCRSGGSSTVVQGPDGTDTGRAYIIGVFDDGVDIGLVDSVWGNESNTPARPASIDSLVIGALLDGGSYTSFASGEVAADIGWTRVLTDSEIEAVGAVLQSWLEGRTAGDNDWLPHTPSYHLETVRPSLLTRDQTPDPDEITQAVDSTGNATFTGGSGAEPKYPYTPQANGYDGVSFASSSYFNTSDIQLASGDEYAIFAVVRAGSWGTNTLFDIVDGTTERILFRVVAGELQHYRNNVGVSHASAGVLPAGTPVRLMVAYSGGTSILRVEGAGEETQALAAGSHVAADMLLGARYTGSYFQPWQSGLYDFVVLKNTAEVGSATARQEIWDALGARFDIAEASALTGTAAISSSLTADASGSGVLSGEASTGSSLTTTINGVGSLSATASTGASLTTAVSGTASVSGEVASTSSLTASLAATGGLAAVSSTLGSVTATAVGNGALSGTASINSTLTADVFDAQADAARGTAETSGSLTATVEGVGALGGTSATGSTLIATVVGQEIGALSATAITQSSLNATLEAVGSASSSVSTVGTLISDLFGVGSLSATASTESTLSGVLDSLGDGSVSGTAATSSSLVPILEAVGALSGTASTSSLLLIGSSDDEPPVTPPEAECPAPEPYKRDRRAIAPPGFARVKDIPRTVGTVDTSGSKPSANKTRADFRVEEFIRLILQKGYFCRWRKAMLCPCIASESQQVAIGCDTCDGSGYFYIDPIDLQVLITNMEKTHKVYNVGGEWMTGSANLTTEPQYRLGYRDSVELLDSVMVYNEWITKNNRRGPRRHLGSGVDAARYRIISVIAAFYNNPDEFGQALRLEEGVHFEVTDRGLIRWLACGNEEIPDGSKISIHYEMHPIFIVEMFPHAVRDTVVRFKQKQQTVKAMPLQTKANLDFIVMSNVEVISLLMKDPDSC